MKKTYLFLVLVIAMLSFNAGVFAQGVDKDKGKDKKGPVVNSLLKEIQGEVSTLGSRFISVVYSRDAEKGEELEMLLPFDPKTVKLEHKQSLKEIATGDAVLVQYTEDTSDYGDRQETKIKAVTIRFLNPADAQSRYKAKASVQEEAQDNAGLSLKGVKSDE